MNELIKNYYKVDGPAVISFSGGATSGFMLHQVIQAYGGKLPDNIIPVFANTGLEHPKTYDFIKECSNQWNVKVYWVEYQTDKGWKEVDYDNCSRNGEPFDFVIEDRQYIPNPVTRFCTIELKIKTMDRFIKSIGWGDDYTELIGLRFDEPYRVAKLNDKKRKNEVYCPMYYAKNTLKDVDDFWNANSFKLEISRLYGNCVGCFLKGAAKLSRIAQEDDKALEWWASREEKPFGYKEDGTPKLGKFRSDRPSYRGLITMANEQTTFNFPDDDTIPCSCTD